MSIKIRQQAGNANYDQSAITTLSFSQAAGAQKQTDVGNSLLPLGDGAGGFTTNATTAKILPNAGRNLAVYNTGALAAITLGYSSTQAAQAPGAVDSTTGMVGIPCTPNAWTLISCSTKNWVIASSASLLVFLIEDDTYIRPEATK